MSSSNYVLEYAKTGRSTCKGCNKLIDDKSLRLSVQSTKEPEPGEKDHRRFTNNRHVECLTKVVVANGLKAHGSLDEFPGMEELQPADQERVRNIVDRVLDGTWMAPGWHLDGTWMAPGWHLDGTWMAPGWHLDGTWMAPG
ncbi:hypothetical protein HXX76_001600 [Chlamydomonas incerta]|nr:hypothetical protein HXX76_001600 [Chlamydomonas incerta]|eukprot:KAG2444862.1 hypothetical protein HXX76_001600 [Chlamydomonas incerta]